MLSLKQRYWLAAVSWVSIIYSTLYIVRPMCEFLRKYTPFSFLINFFMILFAVVVVILFILKLKPTVDSYGLLGMGIVIYASILWSVEIAEEKIHFIEYGLLAYFIFRALCFDIQKRYAYGLALILTIALGWIDEGIQHLLPNRFYDTRDVLFNGLGGLLGLYLTFIVQRAKNKG